MMRHLAKEFPDLPVGLSDHTPESAAAVAAAMLGAVMIEKHFTHTPGPAAGDNRVGENPDLLVSNPSSMLILQCLVTF